MNKPLTIIRSESQYQEYMDELMVLIDGEELQPGTDRFDRFELLSVLIEDYESKEYPIEKPSPIEAIKFRMDQQGLNQKDMQKYLGSKSKVSEVLSGKVPLSLNMIRKVHEGLGIPLDILIQTIDPLVDAEAELNPFFNHKTLEGSAFISDIDEKLKMYIWSSDRYITKSINRVIETKSEKTEQNHVVHRYDKRSSLGHQVKVINAISDSSLNENGHQSTFKNIAEKRYERTAYLKNCSQIIN